MKRFIVLTQLSHLPDPDIGGPRGGAVGEMALKARSSPSCSISAEFPDQYR